jgi:hypothetical protein
METWAVYLQPLIETYIWIELREMPVWSTGESPVKDTADMLLKKKVIKAEEYKVVFDEMINIKTYLRSVPLENGRTIFDKWNQKNTPLEQRWLHIFAELRKKSVSYAVFAKMVEYTLMIPGNI